MAKKIDKEQMGIEAFKALMATPYVQSILDKMPEMKFIDLDETNDATAFEANQLIFIIPYQAPIEDSYIKVKQVALNAGCDDHALCGVSVAITVEDKSTGQKGCRLTESRQFPYSADNLAHLSLQINGMNNKGDVVFKCGKTQTAPDQTDKILQSLRTFFPVGRGI